MPAQKKISATLTHKDIIEIVVVVGLFLVIIAMVSLAIYMYVKHHHNEYKTDTEHKIVRITNVSQHPTIINTPDGKEFPLSPGEGKEISMARHDTLKSRTYFYDGTVYRDSYPLSNPKVHSIYVTNSGFRSNISGSRRVVFNNLTDYPVTIVERGIGGRRWEVCALPAFGMSEGHFVGKNTTLEVVKPDFENHPVSFLTVGGIPSSITFDGNTLRAI